MIMARGFRVSDLARWEPCGIPSSWRSPTTRLPRGQHPLPTAGRPCQACPRGSRVVALGEVDGMTHPSHPTEPGVALVAAIPEICPPGEGAFRGVSAEYPSAPQSW
jgi:hypothetical protein